MFNYQRQPYCNVCGQTVVAMVTGQPVETVIAEMRKRKTRPADLQTFLGHRGWSMIPDGTRLPSWPTGPAILFAHTIVNNKLLGHWVLWTGAEFLDPEAPERKQFGGNWAGRFYSLQRR